MNKLKLFILALLAPLTFAVSTGAVVYAQQDCPTDTSSQSAVTCGINSVDPNAAKTNAEDNVNSTIQTVINILSVIIGVVAVIMLLFGGVRFITSGGNEQGVKSAKNTITYAIIGLVVVALAQVIAKFILNHVTNHK